MSFLYIVANSFLLHSFIAAVTAILAMLWSGSTLIYVSMSLSLLLSSLVTVQRIKLSRQESEFFLLASFGD